MTARDLADDTAAANYVHRLRGLYRKLDEARNEWKARLETLKRCTGSGAPSEEGTYTWASEIAVTAAHVTVAAQALALATDAWERMLPYRQTQVDTRIHDAKRRGNRREVECLERLACNSAANRAQADSFLLDPTDEA